jgi:O-antigen ligase
MSFMKKLSNFINTSQYKDYNFLIYIFLFATFYTFIFSGALYNTLNKIFYITLVLLLVTKKIKVSDIVDIITCSIAVFFIMAVTSNLNNDLPIANSNIIICWFFPYLLTKLLIRYNKICPERFAYMLCVSVLACAIIGVIGNIFSVDIFLGKKIFILDRFSFTFDGPNRAAFYLSSSILILSALAITKKKSLDLKNIITIHLPIGIMLFALILTAEKKSIYLLPFFIFIFIIISKKFKLLLVLITITACVLFSTQLPKRLYISYINDHPNTLFARLNAWDISYKLIEHKPITGHGFGSFSQKSKNYFENNKNKFSFRWYKPLYSAHNVNITILVEMGIIGLILLNAILLIPVYKTIKSTNENFFVFYIALTIIFIYIEIQFSTFTRSFPRTNYTFLLIGICMGFISKIKKSAFSTDQNSSITQFLHLQ